MNTVILSCHAIIYTCYKIETVRFVEQQHHPSRMFYRNEFCAQQFPYTHLLDEQFKLFSFPWFSSNFQQRKQSQWESSERVKAWSGTERRMEWNWERLSKKGGREDFQRKRIRRRRRRRRRTKKRMWKDETKRTRLSVNGGYALHL